MDNPANEVRSYWTCGMCYSTWVRIIVSVLAYLMPDRDLSLCAVGAVSVLLCTDLKINRCLHPPDATHEHVHRTKFQLLLNILFPIFSYTVLFTVNSELLCDS